MSDKGVELFNAQRLQLFAGKRVEWRVASPPLLEHDQFDGAFAGQKTQCRVCKLTPSRIFEYHLCVSPRDVPVTQMVHYLFRGIGQQHQLNEVERAIAMQ